MLSFGPWQVPAWPFLLTLWAAFNAWLAANPLRSPLLVAACFIWAARRDSWRVHILPVPGLLLVMLLRLLALGGLWAANTTLAPTTWSPVLCLAVHGFSLVAGLCLLRGALFLLMLALLRALLVVGLAGGGALQRRRRVVDWALRLAVQLEGHGPARPQ